MTDHSSPTAMRRETTLKEETTETAVTTEKAVARVKLVKGHTETETKEKMTATKGDQETD